MWLTSKKQRIKIPKKSFSVSFLNYLYLLILWFSVNWILKNQLVDCHVKGLLHSVPHHGVVQHSNFRLKFTHLLRAKKVFTKPFVSGIKRDLVLLCCWFGCVIYTHTPQFRKYLEKISPVYIYTGLPIQNRFKKQFSGYWLLIV